MFEKLITQVLNKVLGDFIEDIDPAQLNISILNGNVQLLNMKMKSTLFESLPFPFQLDYGQIGTINLKIPVLSILTQPLVIEISDVFAIVRPKHIKEWNEEVEQKAYRSSNQSLLQKYELFTQSTDTLSKKDPSSIDKMLTKIVDNLEISIKNIYIRYEDSFSAPNHGEGKFVLGVLLKEFSTFTTGTDFKKKFMATGEEITNKLAKIKNFTIFMDYQFKDKEIKQEQKGVMIIGQNVEEEKKQVYSVIDYDTLYSDKSNKVFKEIINNELTATNIKHSYIVDNFSLEARLKLNKNPITNKGPQLDIDLLLGGQFKHLDSTEQEVSVNLHVHQPQIIRLLKLLEYIGYYNEFQNGALTKFQDKSLTQEVGNEYIKHYVEWKTVNGDKKSSKAADEKKELMKLVEDEYPAEKLIILRKFANKILNQQEEEKKTQDDIEKKVKDLSGQKKGWGLFTSKEKKAQQQKEVDDYRQKLEEDFKKQKQIEDQELDQELALLTKDLQNQYVVNKEDFDKMELGYIRFKLKISVPAVVLKFYNEFEQIIFQANIIEQIGKIDLGKGVTKVSFSLYSIAIDDYWTGAKAFPRFVETKELNLDGQVVIDQSMAAKTQAIIFELEMNPEGSVSPFKISVKLEKPIFLIANFHFIKEIKRSLISAFEGEDFDFSFFQEAATEKALKYIQSGKEIIEAIKKGQFKHKAVDLSVHMTAPIILVPENIFNPHKPCLSIDLGSISLNSTLAEYKPDRNYQEETSISKLYDIYEIKIENFQINILDNGLSQGISDYCRGQGSQIIKKFDASINFFSCLETAHPLFPALELSIIIQNFEAQFGLKFVKNILRLQNAIMEQLDSKEDKIFVQADKKVLSQFEKMNESDIIKAMRRKTQAAFKKNAINLEDDEYQDLLEDIDPSKYKEIQDLHKKYSYKVPQQDIQIMKEEDEKLYEKGQSSKFKIYFSAEKLQLTLKDEGSKEGEVSDSIMNVLILHFGLEVDIDRKLDPNVNISIYKFLIEDIQRDATISLPFRMILSSPLSEEQRESNNIQDVFGSDEESVENPYQYSVLQRSLLALKHSENNEVFRDTLTNEEQRIINEFELQVRVVKNHIDVGCQISDLRFVFAVPTAQKLAQIGLKVKELIDLEDQELLKERKLKLEMYEYVLARLQQVFQTEEENLVKRIFTNYAYANGLDPLLGQLLYQESIERIYNLYDIQKDDSSVDIKDIVKTENNKESMWLRYIRKHNEKLYEKTEEIKKKLQVKAHLKNLSIWIPLNAEKDDSQVLSLSLMSDLRFNQEERSKNTYEVTLNELIKKEPIESNDQLAFSINHLTVEMLQSNNYIHLLQHKRQTNDLVDADIFQSSRLIQPCRATLQMNTSKKYQDQIEKMDIGLNIEPIQIRIGFKHIDFANMILVEIDQTLNFIQQIIKDTKAQEGARKVSKDKKKLKEEVKVQAKALISEIKIEESKEEKLKKFRKDQKFPTKIQTIKIELDSLSVSLNDDNEFLDYPLVQVFLSNANVNLKTYEREDDAATFILKKMGIFQKRNTQAMDQVFKDISAFAMLNINYYNQRSLSYEPLLESYYLIASLQQLSPFSAQNIKLQSDKMLNVNLTFGMALTINKIKERVMESLKASQILRKVSIKKEEVTIDELQMAKNWTDRMNEGNYREDEKLKENQTAGFVFVNYTGLKVKAEVHDSMKEDLIKQKSEKDPNAATNLRKSQLFGEDKSFNISGKIHNYQQVKLPFETLYTQQKEIIQRKHKGQFIEGIEEEALKMDFEFEGLDRLSAIPIENLGVHSYRVDFVIKQKKGSQGSKYCGVICNVKMEGNIKKISLESQVLIANNLNQAVTIFVAEKGSKAYPRDDERAVIEPDQVFRVPLSWLFGCEKPLIFIEAKANNYELLKNLDELFTDNAEQSKLTEANSQIIRLQHDYFVSVDIQSFKCLPKIPENGPPQYLISFNPPVMISNYNFQPLEIVTFENQNSSLIALMGPKETGYLNNIDGYSNMNKPNLQWTFYENQSDTYSMTTKNFSIPERLEQQQSVEKFTNNAKNKKDLKYVYLTLEMRKNHFYNIFSYQENFELRQKSLQNFTSSVQIMIYPRYMMINKTSMPIICEGQTILPYTNEYFNQKYNKVQFKIPGYSYSSSVDVSTVGLSGAIQLDLDSKKDVMTDKLPQRDYIPSKIEMGIVIETAPSPFNKTVLIQIVPRFVVVNQLGIPLVLKQKGCKNQVLIQGEQIPYNFESNKIRQLMIRQALKDELIGVSQAKNLYQDLANDDSSIQFWSSPFQVDDVDDFQVAYPAQEIKKEEATLWYNPSDNNNFHRFVRIIVTTQNDATILVVFTNPVFPEYEIVNKTDTQIEVAQMQEASILNTLQLKRQLAPQEMIVGRFEAVSPKTSIPYVWNDRSYTNRLLAIKVGNTIKDINIDNAMEKVQFSTTSQIKYNVQVSITGNAKRIKVSNINSERDSYKQAKYLQNLLKRYQYQQFNIGIDLRGIGLSFIDDKPEELLYLSLFNIKVEIQKWAEQRQDGSGAMENITKLTLHLNHLQLDNMANNIMPVILAPTRMLKDKLGIEQVKKKPMQQIEESKEEAKQVNQKNVIVTDAETDLVPFIQLIATIAESEDLVSKTKQTRLRAFQFMIQEFNFQIETSILNTNLKFILELIQTFSDRSNYKVILANSESFEKSKAQKREEICEALDSKKSLAEGSQIQTNKMFIEYVHLGAIKAIITFKLEKTAVDIDIFDPSRGFGILNIFYSILANVASFSNSNLAFSELILTNVFVSEEVLTKTLAKNYTRQAVMQFYKLIGSSDIIGNPVGLVNKLGTGVYEFVSEPTKGLLKGPDEFVEGVGKGVQSLVTNVISGGFESVGKITGSLYNVVKNVGGETKTDHKKPDNVADGLYQGVKGGVSEIFGGVTGIFTKPMEKTQKEGAKGFIKGLGQGLFGAITAPVTATLRIGTNVAQGVASTATTIGNIGKDIIVVDTNSIYSRFRPPRYITARNVITDFNEELAAVATIVNDLSQGKYANQSIKYFCHLPETKPTGDINNPDPFSTQLIITEGKLFYLRLDPSRKSKPTLLFKVSLRKVQTCEVYQSTRQDNQFMLLVTCYTVARGQYKYVFVSNEYAKLEKMYNMLSILPQVEAEDRVRGTSSTASKLLDQIF